jgi:hypothetical protein
MLRAWLCAVRQTCGSQDEHRAVDRCRSSVGAAVWGSKGVGVAQEQAPQQHLMRYSLLCYPYSMVYHLGLRHPLMRRATYCWPA